MCCHETLRPERRTCPAGKFKDLLGNFLTGSHIAWGRRRAGESVWAKHRALLGGTGKCTETPGNNYTWSQLCCKKQNELLMRGKEKDPH